MTEAPTTLVADPPLILCFHCEYDLRGLSREGRCPKCGSGIDLSWRREEERRERGFIPLWMAKPRWLWNMTAGCAALIVCAVLLQSEAVWLLRGMPTQAWLVMQWIHMVFLAAGLWLLGAREVANRTFVNSAAVRWSIRCILLLDVLMLINANWIGSGDIIEFARWWSKVQGVAHALASALILLRLADAARRADRRRLARWSFMMLWIMPAALAAQSLTRPVVGMRRYESWFLTPHPMVGFAETIVVVPFSAFHDVPIDWHWFLWAGQALVSLTMIVLIAASGCIFLRAARQTPTRAMPPA